MTSLKMGDGSDRPVVIFPVVHSVKTVHYGLFLATIYSLFHLIIHYSITNIDFIDYNFHD